MENNLNHLKQILQEMGSVLIAYSGGADSTFLLKIAKERLKDNVLAATISSPLYPRKETEEAEKIARDFGARHQVLRIEELGSEIFLNNPPKRCYFCKKELFSRLKKIAEKEKIPWVVDGTNLDDDQDFRPGAKAVRELGIRSPLKEAKLTKKEIRNFSRIMGLPTSDKPPLACLASRIPYGEKITLQKLNMIEKAEAYLQRSGITSVRVRHHQDTARIEVPAKDLSCLIEPDFRSRLIKKFRAMGYIYITLDLIGYRSGSMNEVLNNTQQ